MTRPLRSTGITPLQSYYEAVRGAFTTPWNVKQRFRRIDRVWEEDICAENNADFLHYEVVPLPHADRPDF
jgi:hypothetical protein